MFRALSIIATVAAFAVSAAPASAGSSKPPPRGLSIASSEVFELNTATKRPRAISTRSGGEVVSGIIMSDGRICNPRWGC